jgi:hypothetical protein
MLDTPDVTMSRPYERCYAFFCCFLLLILRVGLRNKRTESRPPRTPNFGVWIVIKPISLVLVLLLCVGHRPEGVLWTFGKTTGAVRLCNHEISPTFGSATAQAAKIPGALALPH